jgi:hypothetical protein
LSGLFIGLCKSKPVTETPSAWLSTSLAHSNDVDQSFRSDADQFGAKRRRTLSV